MLLPIDADLARILDLKGVPAHEKRQLLDEFARSVAEAAV